MDANYTIPHAARIGHIHLKVANLQRSLDFYHGILGFEITEQFGDQVAFISAGGYHHHIALNTWYSKDMPKARQRGVGLFHTAILYPTRKDLAIALKRLILADYPLAGASDHGVSEAIYLNDPDGNGVELYRDRPREDWPTNSDGSTHLFMNAQLNLDELLSIAD